MPKSDQQATEAMRFVEKKSHVTKDGRHVLYKLDWQRRVKELRERCGGQCEYMIPLDNLTVGGVPAVRCSREAADPHHIKLRSRGRDDRLTNLMAVCRHHHQMLDILQRRERYKR